MTKSVEIMPDVFNPVYVPYHDAPHRTQIFYGGSSSGKSVYLASRTVYRALKGENTLACRQVGATIRRSIFSEIKNVINEWGLGDLFKISQSTFTITCTNGAQIIFTGLDDVEKVKSIRPDKGPFHHVWVEEATEVHRASVKQLMKRQRGGGDDVRKTITLSFNPIIQSHWIYKEYFAPAGWVDSQKTHFGAHLCILKTTYKDNRFLTAQDIEDLEGEDDDYFHQVYTLGNWGVLGNVVFTNWEVRDLTKQKKHSDILYHGLDFGFSTDPAAYIKVTLDHANKEILILDEFVAHGLTNQDLAAVLKDKLFDSVVYCDSAEPKSIAELKAAHVWAEPALKGPDSIRHGIRWLKGWKIVVDTECITFQNEIAQYQWKKDRNGASTLVPLDKHNHTIDALRYALSREMVIEKPGIW